MFPKIASDKVFKFPNRKTKIAKGIAPRTSEMGNKAAPKTKISGNETIVSIILSEVFKKSNFVIKLFLMIYFYNTLSHKKEKFSPQSPKRVTLYTCGPTVYWFSHIGNLRTFLFEDILKRVLEYFGYEVFHVMNITDVGHLVSDQDVGEDKILLAAKKEKKSAKEIAKFYEKQFKKDLKLLNIKKPNIFVRASQTIKDQIEFIKILEKKGFTYLTSDGLYFDTSKLKEYGRLWPKKMEILPGARVKMKSEKKNPTDFALWKLAPERKEMVWKSPWGKGFPGWHTECVVMAKKYLKIPFDIHCGGVDHILIHHTNEIAQAEAVFGKILARFWLHGEFLLVNGKKMSKSLNNIFTLNDLITRGFSPLAFRYFCLTAHYRSKLNFTFEALKSSQNALNALYQKIKDWKVSRNKKLNENLIENYREEFKKAIGDDLNTPKALAILWKVVEEKQISEKEKYLLLLDFDRVFGLNFKKIKKERIPQKIKELVNLREKLRKERKFEEADKIREEIKKMGYWIEDTKTGPRLKRLL